MKILDGKKIAEDISKKIKNDILATKEKLRLLIVQVGNAKASNKYVKIKINKCISLGIETNLIKLPLWTSQKKIIKIIQEESKVVDGVIVQLPLPKWINKSKVLSSIPIKKDVDGLNPKNNLLNPATPQAIIWLLKYSNIKIRNKTISVVGQSDLVGKPVADILEKMGANVHRHDQNTGLKGTEQADILIVAVGKKNLITKKHIKKGVVIIDVGINTLRNKKIVGDVNRKNIANYPKAISPVIGGVGPLTVISLISNLLQLKKMS